MNEQVERKLCSNLKCKRLLFSRLCKAITYSVISQVVYLVVFLFLMNFTILHPLRWLNLTIATFTSLATWLYFLPIFMIIFFQGVICSREYVYETPYKTTRISRILNFLQPRNLALVTLHVSTGGLIVWLYLSLLGGNYGFYLRNCGEKYCLVEEQFFLLLNGFWIGSYYFFRNYGKDVNITFPILQQCKLLMIKAHVLNKLKQAATESLWPTFYFVLIYYYKGVQMREWIMSVFGLGLEKESLRIFDLVNSPLLIYSWMFSTLFIYTMLCMRLYFEIFLTEQWAFPLDTDYPEVLTLKDALPLNNYPIVQHLACLDLYNLAIWDPARRQQIFTLSTFGGHPHTWNSILEEILKLVTEFSSNLNKATDIISKDGNIKPQEEIKQEAFKLAQPLFTEPSNPYSPIRNMALPRQQSVNIIQITYNKYFTDLKTFIKSITIDKYNNFVGSVKNSKVVRYFFAEIPEYRINFLLAKGQPIIWAVQGLSYLVTASFDEDKYGVVQKDLPVIATTLITLKQNLDKLSKVSFVNRRIPQDEQVRVKLRNSLRSAVRRSLYNITNIFGPYLSQIPLSKDVQQQMLAFSTFREC